MKNNRLVVKINKPSSEVFAFYIDPENTPLWVDSIIAEQTNEWPIKIGTVYRNQNKFGEWSEYTVTNLKRANYLNWYPEIEITTLDIPTETLIQEHQNWNTMNGLTKEK